MRDSAQYCESESLWYKQESSCSASSPGDLRCSTEKLASVFLDFMNADILTENPETQHLKGISGVKL